MAWKEALTIKRLVIGGAGLVLLILIHVVLVAREKQEHEDQLRRVTAQADEQRMRLRQAADERLSAEKNDVENHVRSDLVYRIFNVDIADRVIAEANPWFQSSMDYFTDSRFECAIDLTEAKSVIETLKIQGDLVIWCSYKDNVFAGFINQDLVPDVYYLSMSNGPEILKKHSLVGAVSALSKLNIKLVSWKTLVIDGQREESKIIFQTSEIVGQSMTFIVYQLDGYGMRPIEFCYKNTTDNNEKIQCSHVVKTTNMVYGKK